MAKFFQKLQKHATDWAQVTGMHAARHSTHLNLEQIGGIVPTLDSNFHPKQGITIIYSTVAHFLTYCVKRE